MTWLNPAAFAFLALIPVVLVLHALRHRRRDVRVSTLFLWESVLREAHGSLGLQRLVQNLPLLLQLLLPGQRLFPRRRNYLGCRGQNSWHPQRQLSRGEFFQHRQLLYPRQA